MVKYRIAPTPSGFLHLGNGINFLLNANAAIAHNGRLMLRIDDLDAERKKIEYLEDIFETLDWLHIDIDEGPQSVADFEKNWSQHLRLPYYFEMLDLLRKKNLLFPCQKSRSELVRFQGKYPHEFRHQNLDFDAPDVAWRIKTPDGFPLPDFVVRRRDGVPAYQIASVFDDVFFEITHLLRGEDLFQSTMAQRFIAEQLGWTQFLKIDIKHHPLLKNEHGEKLSKSNGAAALKTFREQGATSEVVARLLSQFPAL